MSVTVTDSHSVSVFRGEEDSSTAGPRREALRRCLRSDATVVTVDLGEATFLDSSVVGDLVHLAETLERQGRQLELRRCSRDTLKLMKFAGLGMIDSVHFTQHAAPGRVLKRQSV